MTLHSLLSTVQILPYQDLSLDDALTILTWRNHVNIRKWMANQEYISQKDHLNFIKSLIGDQTKYYCMIKLNGAGLGAIYLFNITEREASWGFFLNPDLLGKSFGILLEYFILELSFQKFNLQVLNCETKENNTPVLKMHFFFCFREYCRKDGFIFMKISSEEWNAIKFKYLLLVNKFLE